MSFPNYVTGDALLGNGWAIFESNRSQALQGNVVVSGLAVSQRSAGANMSVDVAVGSYLWAGTTVTKASVSNVIITAADGSNPRYDVIYANSSGTIGVTTGTAASSPAVPDLAASSIALAVVAVAAGVTSIVNANITDLRLVFQPVVASQIASDAVTTAKILDANVTTAKLAADVARTYRTTEFTLKTASDLNATSVYEYAYAKTGITPVTDVFVPSAGDMLSYNRSSFAQYVKTGGVYGIGNPICLIAAESCTFPTNTTNWFTTSETYTNGCYGVSPTIPTPTWGSNTGTIGEVFDGNVSDYDETTPTYYRTNVLGSYETDAEEVLLKIDLGSVKSIYGLSWAAAAIAGGASTQSGTSIIKLKSSTDDSTYTTHSTQTASANTQQVITSVYEKISGTISARYIEVTVSMNTGNSGRTCKAGVWEIVAWV